MQQLHSPPLEEMKVQQVEANQQLNAQKCANSKRDFIRRVNKKVVEHPDVLQHFNCSLIEEIANGGFGTVFKALSSKHGEIALKCIPPRVSKSGSRHTNEVLIFRAISHSNILRYYDYYLSHNYCFAELPDCPFLIISTELLQETLHNVIDQPVGLSVYRRLVAQIGSALHYLHSKFIAHHDIKTENIMTDKHIDWHTGNRHLIRSQLRRCTFKLIDLGLARHYPNGPCLEEHYCSGTRQFSAPEKQAHNKSYNPSLSDTYSLGIVLLKCWLGNAKVNRKTKEVKGPSINWFNLAHTLLKGKTPIERLIIGTLAPEESRLPLSKLIEGTVHTKFYNSNWTHHWRWLTAIWLWIHSRYSLYYLFILYIVLNKLKYID